MNRLISILLLTVCGCSVVHVTSSSPNGTSTTATAYVPAYPWQDSNQIISRLTASASTNRANISLRDTTQSEVTNTNATQLIENVVAAAVGAAVKAAAKP